MLELLPIGTVLAILTTQVLETALAAQDVLVEKESFRILAQYLHAIQPILGELNKHDLKESPAVRIALEALQEDVKRARCVVDKCITKPRFYLLVNCRTIVRDAQGVTQDLGKSLQLLSLASVEVSVDIRNNVNKLKDQMVNTEFQVGDLATSTLNKLDSGLREHKTDRGFANDLLEEIARAVGVPVETAEINKELASFKREKEEAASRKELGEEAFMEQVILLLSRADAAYGPKLTMLTYKDRVNSISSNMDADEPMPPLQSFICPLKQDIMEDPVTVQSGQTYEREQILQWFSEGQTKDPLTNIELTDLSLRSNIPLRQSIEEWVERNYCISIRQAKRMLQAKNETKQKEALGELQQLCEQNDVNKEWIAAEDLLADVVEALKSHSQEVKREALSTLFALVKGNTSNKEKVAESGGVEQIVRCLAREISVAKAAVNLLLELLKDGEHGKNNSMAYTKLEQERSAIFCLVTLTTDQDPEAAKSAHLVLTMLADKDKNVVQMAKANWFSPLITRFHQGTSESKLAMANAVVQMDLTDEGKLQMAEQGAIPPLVSMLTTGNLEIKASALGALERLSTMSETKSYFAEAGAIPTVLHHLFAELSLPNIRESSAAILKNVTAGVGAKYLVESNGAPIELDHMIPTLLAIQENFSCPQTVRKHVLCALLGMASAPSAGEVRRLIRAAQGISKLLPSLQRVQEPGIRNCSVRLLCCLSEEGGAQIVSNLHGQQLVDDLVKLLEDQGKDDIRGAAAGILANLPVNDKVLTRSLVASGALPPLIALLRRGTYPGKENAIGALLRFTEPANLEIQRALASLDILPLLVATLSSGTLAAKTKAMVALKNFSTNTPRLSLQPLPQSGFFCFSPRHQPSCKVHLGLCGARTTFCIVAAEAVPELIALVEERAPGVAEAAVDALGTLVSDDEIVDKGAEYLHQSRAVGPILELLKQGSPKSKEKAVRLLEGVFKARGMKDVYGGRARMLLVDLVTHGSKSMRPQAARVLAQLGVIQEASTYF